MPARTRSRSSFAVRIARAAAARRSSKTTGPRRRLQRVNSRKSWSFSSKPFAGVGVANAQCEEAQAEEQHDNVQHEMLLAAVFPAAADALFRTVRIAMDQEQ